MVTVAVVLAGFVAILSDIFLRSMMFGGGDREDNKAGIIFLVLGIVGILARVKTPVVIVAAS